ncbi:hypothetical protein GGX14DRAFT_567168 [Mycena pura]|uniref:Uncharacterized protein n=1 Tax=Mycena pura TaxID=153505 RepID=A0AAD6YFX1_9AGAR|nr:hypothetical protein GGX14DRAFT_567168 [Mycena pura]
MHGIWGRAKPSMDLPLPALVRTLASTLIGIRSRRERLVAEFLSAVSTLLAPYIFLGTLLIKRCLLCLCAWTPARTRAHFMLGFTLLTSLLLRYHTCSTFRLFLSQSRCAWATPRRCFIPFVADIVADGRTVATDTCSICNVIGMHAGIGDAYGYGMAEVVGAHMAQSNILVPVLAGIWKVKPTAGSRTPAYFRQRAVWKGVPIFLPHVFLLRVHRPSQAISQAMSGACTGGNDNGNRGLTTVGVGKRP